MLVSANPEGHRVSFMKTPRGMHVAPVERNRTRELRGRQREITAGRRKRGNPSNPSNGLESGGNFLLMKRYQKLLGPIALGLSAWGLVLGYCTNRECGKPSPLLDVIGAVSETCGDRYCCQTAWESATHGVCSFNVLYRRMRGYLSYCCVRL